MKAVVGVLVVAMASGCTADCPEGTALSSDHRCEPVLPTPPTECDPETTEPVFDPATGVTTCVGVPPGRGDWVCPAPVSAMKQTVCGQIYDFADGTNFQSYTQECLSCDPNNPNTAGPCALKITAFNAQAFADGTAEPLAVGKGYIDTCGNFMIREIDTAKAGSFIALVVDDATATTTPHPTGVTVTTATTLKVVEKTAVKDFAAWIVKPDTANSWTGATLTTGVFAAVFYAHKPLPTSLPSELWALQAGVTITKDGTDPSNEIPDNDYYFDPATTTRTTITADTETGANGTVLVDNASWDDGFYFGRGGLGPGCQWEPSNGASIPDVVFVQGFRKLDVNGQVCND